MLEYAKFFEVSAMRVWLAVMIVLMLCSACGVKGPLYLPEKRYPQPGSTQTNNPDQIKQSDPSE